MLLCLFVEQLFLCSFLLLSTLARSLLHSFDDELACSGKVVEELLDLGVDVIARNRVYNLVLDLLNDLSGGGTLSFRRRLALVLAALGRSVGLLVLLTDAGSLFVKDSQFFLRELFAELLLLLEQELLAREGGFLSPTRLLFLPTLLQRCLAVFLVRILNDSDSLAAVDLHLPSNLSRLVVLRLALGPFVQVKQGLNDVVVLDLSSLLGRLVAKAGVTAEVEVRERDLIVAHLLVDHFVVVKHLNAEVLRFKVSRSRKLTELLITLQEAHVDRRTGVVSR